MSNLPVFVYGTLKQGECRECCWPHRPLRIEPAWTAGTLVDLGPYPALVEGQDRVLGELWCIAEERLEETLRVLDEVEGYASLADDEYVRRMVTCQKQDGTVVEAWAYYYAHPAEIATRPRVRPNADGLCVWNEKR